MSTNPTDDQALYLFWTEDKIRFGDLDRYGHLNNATFATYAETGRVEFFEQIAPGSTDGQGHNWVVAKLTINFLASGYYPASIRIGTRVSRIGNSSLVLEQGLFSNGKLLALIETVMVWADTKTETAVPIPDEIKKLLADYKTTPPNE